MVENVILHQYVLNMIKAANRLIFDKCYPSQYVFAPRQLTNNYAVSGIVFHALHS